MALAERSARAAAIRGSKEESPTTATLADARWVQAVTIQNEAPQTATLAESRRQLDQLREEKDKEIDELKASFL